LITPDVNAGIKFPKNAGLEFPSTIVLGRFRS
jgi:hypothetical protein